MENKNIPKIQWVSENVLVKIRMEDGTWKEGIAESAIRKIKKDEVVQFERFGFCRFDGIKKEDGKEHYEFWFSHK